MQPGNAILGNLTPQQRQQLDAWLGELEQHWDETRLAALVGRLPADGPLRRIALVELVRVDLRLQWQHGRRKNLESYLLAYPELGTQESVALELIQAELAARRQAGEAPAWSELASRFPRQTGQLKHGMEKLWQAETHRGEDAGPLPESDKTAVPPEADMATLPPAAAPPAAPQSHLLHPPPSDRYETLKELGRGAMGTVWLAKDKRLGRRVALKVPHFRPGDSPDMLARFEREARAAATLSHPNICPVYDVGENGGVPYLTMAYIEGKPLNDVLRARKRFPQHEAAAVVQKLARALDEAHRHGIVHRDLKPSNIMMKQDGEPVIMDFGLARLLDQDIRLTNQGSVLGTPAYMSPEQVQGEQQLIGPASDQYGLGVVLYELLTGQVPFQGPMGKVMTSIVLDKPKSPRDLCPDLDPRLEAVCLKAMAKKIADRYGSTAELAAALGEFLTTGAQHKSDVIPSSADWKSPFQDDTHVEEDSSTKPPGPIPPRPGPGRQWLLALLLAGAAALLVGVLIYLVVNGRARNVNVEIHSVPQGATVYLDGQRQEQFTNGKFVLAVGPHELRLEKAGFEPLTRKLVVMEEDDGKTFPFELIPQSAPPPKLLDVTIDSTPPDATVTLNGEKQARRTRGTFPLKAGTHQLRLEKAGYPPLEKTIEVTPQKVEFHFELAPPLPRLVEITTKPQGARVIIGKEEWGKAPVKRELPVGKHEVRLAKVGYKDRTEQIEVEPGEGVQTIPFDLTARPPEHYALLVGVRRANDEELPDFLHAEPDVVGLGRLLVAGGYPSVNVTVLTVTRGNKEEAPRPTVENLRKELHALCAKCGPQDSLLVALVGHVVRLKDDPENYFCPAGTRLDDPKRTLLPLAEVFRELTTCEAGAKLLLLDGWRHDWRTDKKWAADVVRTRADNLAPPKGVAVLVSCGPKGKGYDHPERRHGVFMDQVLQALLEGPAELNQLAARARAGAASLVKREYKAEQTPELLGDAAVSPPPLRPSEMLMAYRRGCQLLETAAALKGDPQRNEYQKAITAFTEAAKGNPPFPEIYTWRAAAKYHLEDYEGAETDCKTALKLDPDNATAHSHLAEALTNRKEKDIQAALKSHDAAIALDPQYAQAYDLRGQTYFRGGNLTNAFDDFSEAIKWNPRLKWSYYNRAIVRLKLQPPQFKEALEDLNEAIDRIDPNFLEALRLRAIVHTRQGNKKAAQEDQERVKELEGK